MECIQNEKSLNTGTNKLNWRFNYMFTDHKPGLLLYVKDGMSSVKIINSNPQFKVSKNIFMTLLDPSAIPFSEYVTNMG